jgi:hypothetical protein
MEMAYSFFDIYADANYKVRRRSQYKTKMIPSVPEHVTVASGDKHVLLVGQDADDLLDQMTNATFLDGVLRDVLER